MRIQLKRGRDGRDTLACHRDDGSATWAPLHPAMALHDLTHYAVETVLNVRGAFFGLVAAGWDLADFEDKARRSTMPEDALMVEVLVGQLDLERLPSSQRSYPEFFAAVRLAMEGQGVAVPEYLSAEAVLAIRARRAELVQAWAAVAPGGSLDLAFPG